MDTNPTADDVREAVQYLRQWERGRLALAGVGVLLDCFTTGLGQKDKESVVCLVAAGLGSLPTLVRQEMREALVTRTEE